MISIKKNKSGFTLVEVLIGVAILTMIGLTLYSLIGFTLKTIWESKARITATQLANQKIEMARNLSYEDVGVAGGIPNGVIQATETVDRNRIDYTVTTQVVYIDDPFDGTLGGVPDDTLNTDYKRVRVEVSWDYRMQHDPVILITDIAPPGLESEVGGGTLKILVYDAYGTPVPQADVDIVNTDVVPNINISTQTDNQGYIILPGSPESTENYEINVTKTNFSTDATMSPTAQVPSPEKPHASVFEDQTTNISFAIDELSNINVRIQNESGIGLSGIVFDVQGGKTIGLDGSGQPVYKYDQSFMTNASGDVALSNIEWDSYSFVVPTSTAYSISETLPLQPINLLPNTTTALTITVTPTAAHSALIIVKDVNEQPLADAEVNFTCSNPVLDETLTTDSSGQVYFTPWAEATSTLEITLDGYDNYSDTFELSGYHVEEIIMTVP